MYKIKYIIGVIDKGCDEHQIEDILTRTRNESGIKLIGIIDMGSLAFETLIKPENNVIKYPQISDSEFRQFIEPWLYSCLSIIEADICLTIS